MGPTATHRPLPPQHLAFGVSVLSTPGDLGHLQDAGRDSRLVRLDLLLGL